MTPTCEPWPAADLPAYVERGRKALFAEDLPGFDRMTRELEERVPCLEQPVDPRVWATFLVEWSVALDAEGGPWSLTLTSALRAWPEVPRELGPPMLREWTPPAPAPGTAPLPTSGRYWLDGRPIEAIPDLVGGVHLVQREHDGGLESALVRDGRLPEGWIPAAPLPGPSPNPPRPTVAPTTWMVAGPLAGLGTRGQTSSASNDHLPEGTDAALALGVATLGEVGGRVVASWDLGASLLLGATPDLGLAALVGPRVGPVTLGVGAGAVTAEVREDDLRQARVLPQAELGARLAATPWLSLSAVGGASAAAWHARGTAVVAPGRLGGLLRVGYDQAVFVQANGGPLELRHDGLSAAIGAVVVLGARG